MLLGCSDFNLLPTSGFSIKPLKVKHLAGLRRKHPSCHILFNRKSQSGVPAQDHPGALSDSLPELVDFKLFGLGPLVVNKKFGLFLASQLGK